MSGTVKRAEYIALKFQRDIPVTGAEPPCEMISFFLQIIFKGITQTFNPLSAQCMDKPAIGPGESGDAGDMPIIGKTNGGSKNNTPGSMPQKMAQ